MTLWRSRVSRCFAFWGHTLSKCFGIISKQRHLTNVSPVTSRSNGLLATQSLQSCLDILRQLVIIIFLWTTALRSCFPVLFPLCPMLFLGSLIVFIFQRCIPPDGPTKTAVT